MNVEIYRSDDGGKTSPVDPHPAFRSSRSLDRSQRLEAHRSSSDDGGGSVSTDAGKTWTLGGLSHCAALSRIDYHRHFPYDVCGAQQDDGTALRRKRSWGVPARSRRACRRWTYAAGGGEAGYLRADPENPISFTPAIRPALSPALRPPHSANRAPSTFIPCSFPACPPRPSSGPAGSGPSRSCFRRSIRRFCTLHRSVF